MLSLSPLLSSKKEIERIKRIAPFGKLGAMGPIGGIGEIEPFEPIALLMWVLQFFSGRNHLPWANFNFPARWNPPNAETHIRRSIGSISPNGNSPPGVQLPPLSAISNCCQRGATREARRIAIRAGTRTVSLRRSTRRHTRGYTKEYHDQYEQARAVRYRMVAEQYAWARARLRLPLVLPDNCTYRAGVRAFTHSRQHPHTIRIPTHISRTRMRAFRLGASS
jgi:hypothetical protein